MFATNPAATPDVAIFYDRTTRVHHQSVVPRAVPRGWATLAREHPIGPRLAVRCGLPLDPTFPLSRRASAYDSPDRGADPCLTKVTFPHRPLSLLSSDLLRGPCRRADSIPSPLEQPFFVCGAGGLGWPVPLSATPCRLPAVSFFGTR